MRRREISNRATARRLREVADIIERHAAGATPQDRQAVTLALNTLCGYARSRSRQNRRQAQNKTIS